MSEHLTFAMRPVAIGKADAARALGVSVDSFERYIQPDLRVIRRGRLRLFPVAELERWADTNATRVFDDPEGGPHARQPAA